MRLFVALDLDHTIRARIKRLADELRELSPDARWVGEESFHITLKFIGNTTQEQAEGIKAALTSIDCQSFSLQVRGYGFFPGAGAPRVFWIGVQAGETLTQLAREIDIAMSKLDIPAESGPYHPHITLARAGSGSPRRAAKDRPNQRLRSLQQRLASIPEPDFGSITAREFFLYESRLSPKGSIYTKLERFPLR